MAIQKPNMEVAPKDYLAGKRLLSLREAMAYTSMGETMLRAWAKEHGAMRKLGRRIFFDRAGIDRAADSLPVVPVDDDGGAAKEA